MKTLKNYVILYDAECPMCQLYTRGFTQSGMLDPSGRVPYQEMPPVVCTLVDRRRAANEIALVNPETGEVTYGIHSLFKVIANSFPVLRRLFSFPPFLWTMSKLYAFISYNRKVIIPPRSMAGGALSPTFRLRYRLLYLLFSCFTAGFVLTAFAPLLSGLLPVGGPGREYLVCAGQVLCQGLVVSILAPAKRWDYLGNMMTISVGGAVLLAPLVLAARWVPIGPGVGAAYFTVVVGLMFVEHIRRTRLLGLGTTMTFTWTLYRVFVLLFILHFHGYAIP